MSHGVVHHASGRRRPKVSVVIPAFNAAHLLERSVGSVLSQTYPADEIIVIDDGSRDETGEIAKGFGDRVRYIHQPNAGVSSARNRGIEAATHEWVAFLDADDEWLPRKLEVQLDILAADATLSWCCGNGEEVVNGRSTLVELLPDTERSVSEDRAVRFFDAARQRLILQTSGFVIHRRVFDEVGNFRLPYKLCQDRDLWWRIAMVHPRIGYTGEPLYRYYTDTPGSLTKVVQDRSESLQSVHENMLRARTFGPVVEASFAPIAQNVAFDYLRRHASGRARISPDVVTAAEASIRLSIGQRATLKGMRGLPRWMARYIGYVSEMVQGEP